MNLREVEQLIRMLLETDIEELEFARGGDALKIRRNLGPRASEHQTSGLRVPPTVPEDAFREKEPVAGAAEAGTEPAGPAPEVIRSPLVGTFYRASSPDAKPFVDQGDTVSKGQVLCIIEAMKLMNEIESDVDGRIVSILVENGRPVEYGEPLFEIEPL